ncbi:LysR family transcriptional regulator [Raoultibacter phocaeensis]|uniref:LysR family transcriptional regulator n=1 Tax=Raoultibacter phocaeensis TaxID=2479841 RepID=UPI00111866A9|nr:LysR family transcriptional regulator [Raoultibacter phocaeensis]
MSSLEELIVFKDVVSTGNITRTSQRLHMSQPSVSIQIQNLEKEYGVQFFDRTNRGVKLTECGEVFYHYVEEIIQLTFEAREAIAQTSSCHSGDIHVGATFTIGEYLLPFIVREYCSDQGDTGIDAKIADTEVLARDVLDRKLHVALIEGPVPKEPNFTVETFWHDELVVIVPIEHPWCEAETIGFEELTTERLITREQGSGTRKVMELAFARNGFNYADLNIRLELGSTQAIKQAVRCGMGIAIISILTVQEECRLGQLVALRVKDCSFTRPLSILTHTKGHLTPDEQSFIELIRNQKKLLEIFPTPYQ